MQKFKVTFLLDSSNLWFEKTIKEYDFKLKKNISLNLVKTIIMLKIKI